MELDDSYNLNFFHVEESVAEVYREGVKRLRDSNIPERHLEVISDIFESLGESHPLPGMGVEWASEIIPAYRNLARILKEIPNTQYDITSLFSRYGDLFDDYKEGLPIGEERPAQLERAIQELNQLKRILGEHGVNGATGLEGIFERLDEMEDEKEEREKKSQKLEDL